MAEIDRRIHNAKIDRKLILAYSFMLGLTGSHILNNPFDNSTLFYFLLGTESIGLVTSAIASNRNNKIVSGIRKEVLEALKKIKEFNNAPNVDHDGEDGIF